MKSERIHSVALSAAIAMTLGACGDGGGGVDAIDGGLDGAVATDGQVVDPQPQALAAGRFSRTTLASPDYGDARPFDTGAQSRILQLYLADEVDAAGYIHAVSFRRHTQGDGVTCPGVTIKLGHTDLTQLTSPGSANVEDGEGTHVAVFDGTVSIPAGELGEYFAIELQTPFYYNGKDNLVVEVLRTEACSGEVLTSWAYKSNAGFESDYVVDIHGTTNDIYRLARFDFVGGDERLEPGQVVSSSFQPFSEFAVGRRAQWLYMADEIDGSGPIAGIAVMTSQTTLASTFTLDVRMGHTTRTTLGETFAENVDVGSPVTVASQVDFVVPGGMRAGSMVWLPLTNTFDYNGTDNLVIDVTVTNDPPATLEIVAATAGMGRQVMAMLVADATGTLLAKIPHIGLRFHGGKVGVLRANATAYVADEVLTETFPFGFDTTGIRQYLYRSAELGGAGAITTLACRVGNQDAVAFEGGEYTVVMAHTTETTLGTNYADNLSDPSTVFAGPLDLPAKLRGDWHEIPLTTPFAYNGRDNLVVQISGTSGATTAGCLAAIDNGPLTYDRRLGTNGDQNATTGTLYHSLVDMIFDVER